MEITIILIVIALAFYFSSRKESNDFDRIVKSRPDFFLSKESTPFFGDQFMTAEQKLQHLKSDYWKNLKETKIFFTQNRCELCFSEGILHLHHITYIRLGCENIKDVVLLCHKCHQRQHDHYGYDRTTEYYPLIKPKQSE